MLSAGKFAVKRKKAKMAHCSVFVKSHITALSVVFLLSSVSFSNAFISDYNLQKGSFLWGYLGDESETYDQNGNIIIKSSLQNGLRESNPTNLVKVASADNSVWVGTTPKAEDTEEGRVTISKLNQKEKVSSDYITVQKSAVMATANLEESNGNYEEQRYGITKHQVKRGDTVSSIAEYYNISTATILWTNGIRPSQALKPGQVIEILPITGVKHTIAPSDTIESVAGAYKADVQEIIIFNELPADGKLTPGKILIVPNGEKEIPADPAPAPAPSQPAAPARTTPQIPQRANRGNTVVVSTEKYKNPGTVRVGHRFPYGQCTWYVSTRFFVPWGGNAKEWLVNSRAYGYQTGNTAVPGSIMVTNESGYGHVTYVEAVEGNNIIISEMNYAGWARKTTRVVPKGSGIIRGFIYNK